MRTSTAEASSRSPASKYPLPQDPSPANDQGELRRAKIVPQCLRTEGLLSYDVPIRLRMLGVGYNQLVAEAFLRALQKKYFCATFLIYLAIYSISGRQRHFSVHMPDLRIKDNRKVQAHNTMVRADRRFGPALGFEYPDRV